MRRFTCPSCTATVFFDDLTCVACGTELAYDLERDAIVPAAEGPTCASRATLACNWTAPGAAAAWCRACRLDVVPGRGDGPEHRIFQQAKRRVLRQLHRVGVDPQAADPPLRFELDRSEGEHRVTIGHADGIVTLDVAEADPVVREEARAALGEPYRTPLGHVRHETGHWHWQAFVASDPARLARFRELFGDEREDYAAALERHYAGADDGRWMDDHISFYASAHPWEDHAESFAQVLHLGDTLETAQAFDVVGDPGDGFDAIYGRWAELTVVLNELNRSMGTGDPAPFAPRARAIEKIAFAHECLVGGGGPSTA
jgi:hypothetical protein